MPALDPYDVVRIRARWSEDNVSGSPQALLTEFIGKDDSDPELNAHALDLQQPVTFNDPQLGLLTLNRSVDWYEASPDWCGAPVQLTIPSAPPLEMQKALEVARQLWAQQKDWQRKITDCATKELLELKNVSWLQAGEPPLTDEQFARTMVLETISVEPDGSFEFWHDDRDLFWGHSIVVTGTLEQGPKRAALHG
jgi:hypothetical protein